MPPVAASDACKCACSVAQLSRLAALWEVAWPLEQAAATASPEPQPVTVCMQQVVAGNPCLKYCQLIVLPWSGSLAITFRKDGDRFKCASPASARMRAQQAAGVYGVCRVSAACDGPSRLWRAWKPAGACVRQWQIPCLCRAGARELLLARAACRGVPRNARGEHAPYACFCCREYTDFAELEADYAGGAVHPSDLKPALAAALNAILQPVRDHFADNAEARQLLKQVRSYKTTR